MSLKRAQVETLLELVRRYSPSGEEAQATAYLTGRMLQLGYERAFVDEAGNAVGIKGAGERQVVLLGHIDTVKGEVPLRIATEADPTCNLGLDEPEFSPDALFYGRGSVDAKGPLAAFVDAVGGLDVPPGWQFVVIGAVEEEGDSKGARFVAGQYRPEAVVIGEPSRWMRLTLGYKGSAWAELTLRRTEAHSAGQSENACEAAFALWQELQRWQAEFNRERSQVFEQVLLTLRGFSSGSDGFAGWARLDLSARLPLDLPPAEYYQQIADLAEKTGAVLDTSGYAILAYRAEKNSPLVRAFLAAVRQAGGQPGFVLKSGTADMNIVCPSWKCPALAYGPGDSALDHTPQEHASLNEYVLAVEVLKGALRRLTEDKRETP